VPDEMTGICWVDEEESWVFMGTGAVRGDSNWEAGRDGNSGLNCEGRGLQPLKYDYIISHGK